LPDLAAALNIFAGATLGNLEKLFLLVIPAQAGTQWRRFSVFAIELTFAGSRDNRSQSHWVPACAGMTIVKTEVAFSRDRP
jgi:hypothetical protein